MDKRLDVLARSPGPRRGTPRPHASPARARLPGVALLLLGLAIAVVPATRVVMAGDADVTDVRIESLGDGRFRIAATLAHGDTGWDHYADRWDVLADDGAAAGSVIGTRQLAHPHVNEQPFTRSLTLEIPADVTAVTIRAGDSVHGTDGGETRSVEVPR